MNRKPFGPKTHGAIDYIFVVILFLAPSLFDLTGAAQTLCYAFGMAAGVLNALTDHPLGLKRVIPMRLHGQIDTPFVPTLLLLPWATDALKQQNARYFFISFFVVALINYLLTDFNAHELSRTTTSAAADEGPTQPHTPRETIMTDQMTLQPQSVSLDDARRVISAGEEKAKAIGQPMNIAVVDAGGNLVAHIRMDGAWLGSIDISINKAFTARAFDLATQELAENAQPGSQFFGIHVSDSGRVMIFAGGIPLQCGGQIVGAVGVSGGMGEQDQTVAESAIAAF